MRSLGAALVIGLSGALTASASDSRVGTWDATKSRFSFELTSVTGHLDALVGTDSSRLFVNHRLSHVTYKPTNTLVSPTYGPLGAGLFSLFQVRSRDAALMQPRETRPDEVEPIDNGIRFVWHASATHRAQLELEYKFSFPNVIQMQFTVRAEADYRDYEVLVALYAPAKSKPGLYVVDRERPIEQIGFADHEALHGLYTFFPRDERAVRVLSDGRGGRKYGWQVGFGRRYARPLVFRSMGDVDLVMMGPAADVQAVGVTYEGDHDGVARHDSAYLSYFGHDLHKGELLTSRACLVIGAFRQSQKAHLRLYHAFSEKKGSR